MPSIRLANGISLACRHLLEARVIAGEVSRYDAGVLALPPDATILDVGAHIGIFSLSLAGTLPHARVYGFEPSRRTFEVLQRNFEGVLHGRFEPIHAAVGEQPGRAELTCVPMASALSTLHPEVWGAKQEILARLIQSKRRSEPIGHIWRLLPDSLAGLTARILLLSSRVEQVPVISISDFVSKRGLQRIDLLKADCEGHEASVLAGIQSGDWAKIRRVLLEVHDVAGRLEMIVSLLRAAGMTRVRTNQPPDFQGTNIHLVSAVR